MTLHHVGYAAPAIEPVSAQYRARFGYVEATGVIHDRRQTALIQFLHLPGERSYLELVAPDGPASKLSRSTAGAGSRNGLLHHLCYTCGPLEEEIGRLRESGMLLLAEPASAIALGGRRIAWMFGANAVLTELVERRDDADPCAPGLA